MVLLGSASGNISTLETAEDQNKTLPAWKLAPGICQNVVFIRSEGRNGPAARRRLLSPARIVSPFAGKSAGQRLRNLATNRSRFRQQLESPGEQLGDLAQEAGAVGAIDNPVVVGERQRQEQTHRGFAI